MIAAKDIIIFISTIIGVFIGLGTVVALFAYAFAQWKKGKHDFAADNNKDLIDRVKILEDKLNNNEKEIAELKGRVATLSSQKNDLQELILKALENFFADHPEQAIAAKKKCDK